MMKDYLIRIADAIEVVKDTMKRLVDDEPRGDIDTLTEYCAKLAKLVSINGEILKALSALPSVDAVKVVRCRDCIYWFPHTQCGFDEDNDEYHDYCGLLIPDDDYYAYTRKPDDYCSYGKRREDNE